MRSPFFILIIFLNSQFIISDGISVNIKEEVVNSLVSAILPLVEARIKKIKIDDMETKILKGLVTCYFTEIKLLNLNWETTPKIQFQSGEACITTENPTIKVSLITKCRSYVLNPDLLLEAWIKVSDLKICFNVKIDEQHKLKSVVTEQSIVIEDIDIIFKSTDGGSHDKYTQLVSTLKSFIIPLVNSFVAKDLSKIIDQEIEKNIAMYPPLVVIDEAKKIIVDFTPNHAPILNHGILFSTSGYVYQQKDSISHFGPAVFSDTVKQAHGEYGVTFQANDFVLNNLLGVLFKHTQMFERNFSERSQLMDFDFTVKGFSKIFQNLDTKYTPETKTKIYVRAVQAPNVSIMKGYASAFVWLEFNVVVMNNGFEKRFCRFSVIASMDIVVSLEDIKVLKIVPRSSSIIDVDIFELYGVNVDRELLNQTINGALQLAINYFGLFKSLDLDIMLSKVNFLKTMIKMDQNSLELGADIYFRSFEEIMVEKSKDLFKGIGDDSEENNISVNSDDISNYESCDEDTLLDKSFRQKKSLLPKKIAKRGIDKYKHKILEKEILTEIKQEQLGTVSKKQKRDFIKI